ncbi:hypothetical protein REPUB_Repub08aG0217100 [Reevesia pubescens]
MKQLRNLCVLRILLILSKSLEVQLCEGYAQVLCYGTGTVWVREHDIWNDLDAHELMQNVGPNNTKYVYTKRRDVRELISKHALIIAPVCAGLIGCAMLFWKVLQKMYLSARVEELYHQVCDMLEDNALRSKSINGGDESWVVASWLRDHLLLPRERKDPQLWRKVEELVQEDSRVDRSPSLLRVN